MTFPMTPATGSGDNQYGTRLTYLYTSEDEIRRLLSSDGANEWSDDLSEAGEDYYFTEVIEDATGTINQYLVRLYSEVDMVNSPWIRRRATYIAAYHYTKRRGNPGLYGDDYLRCIDDLLEVVDGNAVVPGLPFDAGMQAVMQNVTIDQRYLYHKPRVRMTMSTDTSGREFLQYGLPFTWLF